MSNKRKVRDGIGSGAAVAHQASASRSPIDTFDCQRAVAGCSLRQVANSEGGSYCEARKPTWVYMTDGYTLDRRRRPDHLYEMIRVTSSTSVMLSLAA